MFTTITNFTPIKFLYYISAFVILYLGNYQRCTLSIMFVNECVIRSHIGGTRIIFTSSGSTAGILLCVI